MKIQTIRCVVASLCENLNHTLRRRVVVSLCENLNHTLRRRAVV